MKRITRNLAAIMLAVIVVFAVGCGNGNFNSKSSEDGNRSTEQKTDIPPDNFRGTNPSSDKKVDLTGSFDGHEWVDLGLPSGTLWATCNVGANAPEEYGDYSTATTTS